mgnify:CR=1 FL=1|jgi:hypothetical protein
MKKTVNILSALAILFAANMSVSNVAEAGYWTSTPQYGGGTIHRYTPSMERDGLMGLRFR